MAVKAKKEKPFKDDKKATKKGKRGIKLGGKEKPMPFVVLFVCTVILTLVTYLAISITEFVWAQSVFTDLQANKQQASIINHILDDKALRLQKTADGISNTFFSDKDHTAVIDKLSSDVQTLNFDYYRYYKNDVCYEMNGTISGVDNNEIEQLNAKAEKGITEVFTDSKNGEKVIAFYSPIKNNDYISGVVGYYKVKSLEIDSYFLDYNLGQTVCLVDRNGEIILGSIKEDGFSDNTNVLSFLSNATGDSESMKMIREDLAANRSQGRRLEVSTQSSIVTYSDISGNNGWYLFSVFPRNEMIINTSPLVNSVVFIGAALILLVFLVFLYLWLLRDRYDTTLQKAETIDPITGCSNYSKFKIDAKKLIDSTQKTKYALLYIEIRNYEYINDHFGYETNVETLKYLSKAIRNLLEPNETFCRISASKFLALMRYHEEQELFSRYNALYSIMYNYEELNKRKFNAKLNTGIYFVDREKKYKVSEMRDRALIAQKSNREKAKTNYEIYDEKIRKSFSLRAEIESDMEQALADEHFKIYYQPKYNIAKNRIDGAEALIRWEHPHRGLVGPDAFVPIFEANGFITEVDRYVYTHVCKEIANFIEKGVRTTPISINVSSISAIQPDFVNYYVDCKKKYKIPDGFVELEFTESFAFASYETLRKIVTTLRQNGIRCAIDDFGSGYSSFNTLKEIQMDVIKLDRIFLKHSGNKERDDVLLSAMINLAKAFGIKVVQEGVETPEQLKLLRELGCDAIQGYIYAKPMSRVEFEMYLETAYNGIALKTLREYYGDASYYPQIDKPDEIKQ